MYETPSTRSDPATFEVVKNSLLKAAEEMKIVLAKTAYSPVLKVAGDYSCGIFDAKGDMVAQGPDLPIHLGSMPDAVRAVIKPLAMISMTATFLSTTTLILAVPICRMSTSSDLPFMRERSSVLVASVHIGPISVAPRPAAMAP